MTKRSRLRTMDMKGIAAVVLSIVVLAVCKEITIAHSSFALKPMVLIITDPV
jgi:hypothetical protein